MIVHPCGRFLTPRVKITSKSRIPTTKQRERGRGLASPQKDTNVPESSIASVLNLATRSNTGSSRSSGWRSTTETHDNGGVGA